MILNSLFPVIVLVVVGKLLRHYHLTSEAFLKQADKLVYYIFFPALLFWKIGGTSLDGGIDWDFCLAAFAALATIFLLSTLYIIFGPVSDFEAGTFSQSCYRFNTYIGLAIIITALGEPGVKHFGILIGLVIPPINVLSVSVLIWFSGQEFSTRQRVRLTSKALISNPLILACIAGIIYAQTINQFPQFLNNSFELLTSATLPLALLSIGGALTFTNMTGYFRLSLMGAIFKLCLFPATGYLFLSLFQVAEIPFKVGMIFFALPTSTAIYVLSSQLNSDTELASASIVMSTVLSFFALSVVLMI